MTCIYKENIGEMLRLTRIFKSGSRNGVGVPRSMNLCSFIKYNLLAKTINITYRHRKVFDKVQMYGSFLENIGI